MIKFEYMHIKDKHHKYSNIKIIIAILFYLLNINLSFAQNNLDKLNKAGNNYIISLAPNITELIYEANAQDFLLGVSIYSNYPKLAQSVDITSDFQSVYIEKIVLIIKKLKLERKNYNDKFYALAWKGGTPKNFVDILEKHNIKTIWLSTNSTNDVLTNLFIIYNLTSHNQNNQNLNSSNNHQCAKQGLSLDLNCIYVKDFALKLAYIIYSTKQKYADLIPKTYFYPIWHTPLMTIFGNNYTDSLLSNCNIYNIFKFNKTAMVNPESLINYNPDIIIYTDKNYLSKLDSRYIKNYKGINLNADLLVRGTGRSILALPDTCTKIR